MEKIFCQKYQFLGSWYTIIYSYIEKMQKMLQKMQKLAFLHQKISKMQIFHLFFDLQVWKFFWEQILIKTCQKKFFRKFDLKTIILRKSEVKNVFFWKKQTNSKAKYWPKYGRKQTNSKIFGKYMKNPPRKVYIIGGYGN